MISNILLMVLGKEVILYTKHRQTLPILKDRANREKYYFINILYLWRIIPFRSSNRWKYRMMYLILNVVQPKYIIDINWIVRWNTLYKVWTRHHPKSKFIVIQHGSYIGGKVMDSAHRYTKCDIFLTWGDYFTRLFKDFNKGKSVKIISFGNPVYNINNRNLWANKTEFNSKILIAPSCIDQERLKEFKSFANQLMSIGFEISFKEHKLQGRNFGEIEGFSKESGNIYDVLYAKKYDIIITDYSSVLLDVIYYKNNVLFFSPPSSNEIYHNNTYSIYLKNLFFEKDNISCYDDLYKFVSISAQERLYNTMVNFGENHIRLVQVS